VEFKPATHCEAIDSESEEALPALIDYVQIADAPSCFFKELHSGLIRAFAAIATINPACSDWHLGRYFAVEADKGLCIMSS
jgi:hypothetical protein